MKTKITATLAATALLTLGLSSCGKPEAPACDVQSPLAQGVYSKAVELYNTTDKLTLDDLAATCTKAKEADQAIQDFRDGGYLDDSADVPEDDPTKTSAEVQAENMAKLEGENR